MSGERPARRGQPQRRPAQRPPVQRRPPATRQVGAFAAAASDEPLTPAVLIRSIGGVLGIVEGVLPSLVFLVVYELTSELIPAVLSSIGVAAVFVVIRLIRRSMPTAAFAGAIGVAVSALLALWTGQAKDFYQLGIWTNAAYAVVFAVSALVRWPILGVAGSLLFNDQRGWKTDTSKYRVFLWVTWLWVILFVVRLAVEVPLFISGQTQALGIARLITGVPLYAPVLVVTVLAVRAVYRRASDAAVS